jgi:hypothetical protein
LHSNENDPADYTLLPISLLVENDGAVLMTLFYEWEMYMFKLAPQSSTTSWDTSFVLRQGSEIENSLGFTVIHDDYNLAGMGYYVSGYAQCTKCDTNYRHGGYLLHLSSTGTITWESHPSSDV